MVISEFQMSLIGAGAGLVVAVWVYNQVQERKHRRAADAVFKGTQRDVLLEQASGGDGESALAETPPDDAIRIEPASGEPVSDERREPVFAAGEPLGDESLVAADSLATGAAELAGEPEAALADRAIELVLPLSFPAALAAQRLAVAGAGLSDRVRHLLRWVVQGTSGWKTLRNDDDAGYHHVRAALQLADRQGPITELELVSLITALEKFAAEEGGEAQSPAVEDILVHARALDDFCASIDIQLSLHLVSPSGSQFPGTKLRGVMEANGFSLGQDGLYHLFDEGGILLLSVSNMDTVPFRAEELRTLATHGVTFWLDVPRTPDPVFVYDRMLTVARLLGEAVSGVLVDDQRQLLSDAMLTSIRGRIQEIQHKMKAADLPAGGRRALRLFR